MSRIFTFIALGTIILAACDKPYEGTPFANIPPETYLSSGPPEGDPNTIYKVSFYWNGYDPDGAIDHFEFVVTNDWETGSLVIDENLAETLDSLGYQWNSIEVYDSVISVEASQVPDPDNPADSLYFYGEDQFLFIGQHTFFIRAVDEYGLPDPTPAHRSFTATTIAPELTIDEPEMRVQSWQDMPADIFFSWEGTDSIGNGDFIEPDSTRFALINRGDYGIEYDTEGILFDLPDSIWSRWRGWDSPEDSIIQSSGRGTLVSGLTPFGSDADETASYYIFFAQAKDEAGAVTSHFRNGENMRKLRAVTTHPTLWVREHVLGLKRSEGYMNYSFTVGEGQPLIFTWHATAEYGSEITGFRYGWDIMDPSNDEEWSNWSTQTVGTEASFSAGTHELLIQCRDYSNNRSTLVFRFFVVPFTMDLELLLIDDYDNYGIEEHGYPNGPETSWLTSFQHSDTDVDGFWINDVLHDYMDFVPPRDTLGVFTTHPKPPFEIIANYKNIIWEIREGGRDRSGVSNVCRFFDPAILDKPPYDYVSAYMEHGGKVLFCGSQTATQFMPKYHDVAAGAYPNMIKLPTAYRRNFHMPQGDVEAALENYIPWSQFGIEALTLPVNSNPRPYGPTSDLPNGPPPNNQFRTDRTYWGMTAITSTELEIEYGFPNSYPLPDTLKMRPEVEDWFAYARETWEDADGHFGLFDCEIYNWVHVIDSLNRHNIPPELSANEDLFVHLLSYVPSDSTTRFGSAPSWTHVTGREEARFAEERILPGGEVVYYPENGHMVAMIGLKNPEAPNAMLGFHPYYLRQDHAKLLIDHILVDIFGMIK